MNGWQKPSEGGRLQGGERLIRIDRPHIRWHDNDHAMISSLVSIIINIFFSQKFAHERQTKYSRLKYIFKKKMTLFPKWRFFVCPPVLAFWRKGESMRVCCGILIHIFDNVFNSESKRLDLLEPRSQGRCPFLNPPTPSMNYPCRSRTTSSDLLLLFLNWSLYVSTKLLLNYSFSSK